MIRSIFLAITLLLCGVANADPKSFLPGQHPEFGLRNPELVLPSFCAVSYLMWNETIALDPTVPTPYKMEIQSRLDGLIRELDRYATDINDNGDDAALYMQALTEHVVSIAEEDTLLWLDMAKAADCKAMTEEWASFDVL